MRNLMLLVFACVAVVAVVYVVKLALMVSTTLLRMTLRTCAFVAAMTVTTTIATVTRMTRSRLPSVAVAVVVVVRMVRVLMIRARIVNSCRLVVFVNSSILMRLSTRRVLSAPRLRSSVVAIIAASVVVRVSLRSRILLYVVRMRIVRRRRARRNSIFRPLRRKITPRLSTMLLIPRKHRLLVILTPVVRRMRRLVRRLYLRTLVRFVMVRLMLVRLIGTLSALKVSCVVLSRCLSLVIWRLRRLSRI